MRAPRSHPWPFLIALWALSGCAADRLPALHDLKDPITLRPDEGILVVEVDSNRALTRLGIEALGRLRTRTFISDLAAGRRAKLLVLPAGRYRWSRVEMQGVTYGRRHYPATWILENEEPHWEFEVAAGVVNYPGVLVLVRNGDDTLRAYTLNRSGQLVETLAEQESGLMSAFPIVYSGRGRDDFLEFYSKRIANGGGPASGKESPVDAAGPDAR